MTFAAAYLVLYLTTQQAVTVIPYRTMEQCQEVAKTLGDDNSKVGRAYCIEGSK